MSTPHRSAPLVRNIACTPAVLNATKAYFDALCATVSYKPSEAAGVDELRLEVLQRQVELAKQLMTYMLADQLGYDSHEIKVTDVNIVMPSLSAGFLDIVLTYNHKALEGASTVLRVVNHTEMNLTNGNSSALAKVVSQLMLGAKPLPA